MKYRSRESERRQYQNRKARGVCTACLQPVTERSLCRTCYERMYAARKARAHAEGLCITCGSRPVRENRSDCEYCAERGRALRQRKAAEKRAAAQ